MIATGLSAPTQSSVGIAAATVSPMISYEIGQKFKELAKDNPDGKLTEKQQAAHVLAHAVLGAAVAAAGGNDALAGGASAGGASAGGAEAVAPKVSTFLYGTADPEKLTAEQKDTVANIMSLAGAGVGVAVGNTSANAVSGSLNAESAVENNFSLQDVKDNWNRLTGGLLGVAASFGSAGEPILHPIDTWNGLKEFANSDDKLAVLQMGLILTVEERNQDYKTFVRLNDEFGRGMVIGRSVTDIASAVSTVSKTPALFKTALAQLRKTGHATINGVKVVYVSGKIARAADNYVAPIQAHKPVSTIQKTQEVLRQKDKALEQVNQYNLKQLPNSKLGNVIRNALDDKEYQQAMDIVQYKGGEFIGAPNNKFPGIDGWLDNVPVQLKVAEGKSILAVQRNIVGAANDMKKANYQGDVYLDITKTEVTLKQLSDFVKPNTPIFNILKKENTVNNIYVKTSQGWLKLM